jgi:CRP/FNR family transcriptional regulator, cyclic AMP receptor protein
MGTVSADLLKKVYLFQDLTAKELEQVLAICEEESFAEGAEIVKEGDQGDRMYLIVEGRVRIQKSIKGIGNEALAILETGDFFGEMALVEDVERSADAIAHEGSAKLLSISKEKFESLLFLNKDIAHTILWQFVRTLSGRLRETNEKVRAFFAMSGGF